MAEENIRPRTERETIAFHVTAQAEEIDHLREVVRFTTEHMAAVHAALDLSYEADTGTVLAAIGGLQRSLELRDRTLDRAWDAIPEDVEAIDDSLASHIRAALARVADRHTTDDEPSQTEQLFEPGEKPPGYRPGQQEDQP